MVSLLLLLLLGFVLGVMPVPSLLLLTQLLGLPLVMMSVPPAPAEAVPESLAAPWADAEPPAPLQ